jgi:iron complex outermembrane receptor protein
MYVDAQTRKLDTENTAMVDSCFLLNAKITYSIPGSGNVDWEVFLAGENLTDTDYEYLPGYPMPGATGMIGVSFSM